MATKKLSLTPEIYFREVPKAVDMTIRSELYATNEFTFAVAVILSAQATDKKVNEVTPALFAVADTPEKMLALGETGLKKHIRVISFFNNKAKNIMGLAAVLAGQYSPPVEGCPQRGRGGSCHARDKNKPPRPASPSTPPQEGNTSDWHFPKKYHTREALMALPGIGQKTANVVMNALWSVPMIGVDTHVFRNAHRYGWVTAADNTPERVEEKLLKLIPKKYHGMVNHVMVLHGRYTCKALRPDCAHCPVAKWCDATDKII
ncbi:MAG: endonuclease III [Proteobacteria bacterium]|nr:endonuclease III [Pseudomonadota bacterium]